ncbi:MAG: inorganic phosphate transporter [Thiohalomonadaceae bacterium]
MEYATVYIVLACAFGLFMAWGVGANDVANAMGTSVGSGALTVRQAIIIAAIFEFAGAVLAGGEVTETIRNGMIDSQVLAGAPDLLVFGMLASLLSAGIWLLVASHFGWPVSTTHTIVGAIVGFAAVGIGIEAVHWEKIVSIIASWVVSPVLAGIVGFALFRSVQVLILEANNPLRAAKRWVPMYMFIVGLVVALVTLRKGLKHVGLELDTGETYLLSVGLGALLMGIGNLAIMRMRLDPSADIDFHFANVEKVFGILMLVTACATAFAHGSNDVANAVGPMAAVIGLAQTGLVNGTTAMPPWILLVGGIGIVVGLVTFGQKVMGTVGSGICELTPSRGFAATLSAAGTVVFASAAGLPISTTHTLVGGVLGVGLARGIAALNLEVVRNIFMSWVVTLPAGAFFAILFFYILRAIFG